MILIDHKESVFSEESPVFKQLSVLPNMWVEDRVIGELRVVQMRVDPQEEWDYAISDDGRYALWVEGRPYINGESRLREHITKKLLECYLQKENLSDVVLSCDGGTTLFLYDLKEKKLEIATDILGLYPVYHCLNKLEGAISTHSDWLADHVSTSLSLDEVSALEQILHSSISPPYTLYKGIEEYPGACKILKSVCPKLTSDKKNVFWKPRISSDLDFHSALELTKESLEQAVHTKTRVKSPKTVFLSGGADSRLILGANQDSENTKGITFVDRPNQESNVAKELARISNISHEVIIREKDHYSKTMNLSQVICGGMGSPMDNHFLSYLNDERISNCHSLLTGCHGDYFFKSVFTPKKSPTILGKNLPIPKIKNKPFDLPKLNLSSASLLEALELRWAKRLEYYLELTDGHELNALEASRVMPLSREIDSGFRSALSRVTPWDPLFYTRGILDIIWRIPVQIKMNHQCYEKAVAEVVGSSYSKIPNINYGSKLGDGKYMKSLKYLKLLSSKIFTQQRGTSSSSWPNCAVMLNENKELKKIWGELTEQSYLKELCLEASGRTEFLNEMEIGCKYELIGLQLWLSQRELI